MTKYADLIAIVDDDPFVLKALARLLNAHALKAETFGSAHEFLASLANGVPECLIVDLQMPGMTGLDLQNNLIRRGFHIPTIVVTAHYESDMRKRCEAAGAIAFLSKPLQDTSLFAAIEDARRAAKM